MCQKMNGYASTPHNGFESHGSGNGHMPNGYGGQTPRQIGNSRFMLNRRKERIDWRKIASVNIEYLTRTLDVEVLRENISSIAYCDIEEEVDTRIVDPNFLKVFKMSQLIIQYLVHTQDYFADTIKTLKEEAITHQQQYESQKKEVEIVTEQLNKVKQESHKRKKLLKAQQSLIQSGVNNYHQCAYCPKAFTQAGFLQSHLQRKHSEYVSQGMMSVESQNEMKKMEEVRERLENEMEELKEKLQMTQTQLEEERGRLEEQMLQQQQKKSEGQAQEEALRNQFKEWKEEQTQIHRAEMEKMQSMFMKELKDMHENYSVSQAALEDLQSKLGKRSNLGTLVDEDELADQRKKIKEQKKQMTQMKEEFEEKIREATSTVEEEKVEIERKWEQRLKDQKKRYNRDTKELKELLEKMGASLKEEKLGGSDSEKKYKKQIQDVLQKSKEYEAKLKEREKELEKLKRQRQEAKQRVEVSKPPPSPTPPSRVKSPSPEESSEEEELVESEELTRAKTVETMRKQIGKTLQIKLEQRGVPQGVKGISNQSMEIKLRQMKQERQGLAMKHAKFYDVREQLRTEIDKKMKGQKKGDVSMSHVKPGDRSLQFSKASIPSSSNTFPRSQSKPKSILSKPKDHEKRPVRSNSLPGSSARKKTPPPVAPRNGTNENKSIGRSSSIGRGSREVVRKPTQSPGPTTSTPKVQGKSRLSAPRVSFEDDVSEDDDEEDEEEDDDDDVSLEDESETEEVSEVIDKPVAKPRPSPRQAVPVTIPRADSVTNGNAQGNEAGDSDWDSEDISALDEVSPGKIQRAPQISSSTPKGPMVAELSRSIEAQLQGRQSLKKPVGGVDLSGTGRNGALSPDLETASPSPRIPTLPDEESDDSLAISSLDNSVSSPAKPVVKPAAASRPQPNENNSKSVDSSNTYGTSVWGTSSNKAASAKGTNKSSLVSVTDFDDDDDLDFSD